MTERSLVPPHGGKLEYRWLDGDARDEAKARALALPTIVANPRVAADLECIASGIFSPLPGFMGSADYESVIQSMRLSNGLIWSLPIVLPVDDATASRLRSADQAAIVEENGRLLALVDVEQLYKPDKEYEAAQVFGTTDPAHPGVRNLHESGSTYVAGSVYLINRPSRPLFEGCEFSPHATRRLFRELGWKRVVAFQTRNPVHRAHEYIQKCALETVDGLLLHPLVGQTKGDDIPASLRMASYRILLDRYYPPNRTVLGVFPAAMRYAGPKEAVFHAICRKNYGCSHFIIGRDHAGVGGFYGPYDSHRIFDQFKPDELGITPLFFDQTFFCRACGQMASEKSCPHGPDERVTLSGTRVRTMLAEGERLPTEFTRPEVAEVLRTAYASIAKG